MQIQAEGEVFSGDQGSDVQSSTFPMACVTDQGRWLCTFRCAPQKISNVGHHVLLTYSDDQGQTWSTPTDPFEAPAIDGKPGRFRCGGMASLGNQRLIIALNWVDYSTPDLPYFNEETEGLLDTKVFLAYSEDDGDTWGTPTLMDTSPYTMPTPITGPLLRLNNGTLVCQIELNKIYLDTEPWQHASVLLFSDDDGQTWPRHRVVSEDPEKRIFYWDQRPSCLEGSNILDAFWTFDRETAEYLNIHLTHSEDNGDTWSALWDTGVPGQPGPLFPLSDDSIAMPVVDRRTSPKVTIKRSQDGGKSWPEEDRLIVYDSAEASQTESKSTMQDAWSEMYAFSVGLPNSAPLPGGGALLVYYAGSETNHTAIRWALIT